MTSPPTVSYNLIPSGPLLAGIRGGVSESSGSSGRSWFSDAANLRGWRGPCFLNSAFGIPKDNKLEQVQRT